MSITSGWLKKETSGAIKRFERRWVVIQGISLSYYKKDDASSEPLGVINLPGKRITQPQAAEGVFKFDLIDRDDISHFMCETKSEREKFIDAISSVCYAPFGGGMFGTLIEVSVRRERVHGGGTVPRVISQCIGFLDTPTRIVENGIFRLPGNERTVKQLKMDFQEGLEPNLEIRSDTHTVASLLKLYLRVLPDSIIPSSLYEDFVSIILTYEINPREGLNEMQHLLKRIPPTNFNTLRMLCMFLYKVQTYSASNLMDLNNLAIVFSPTILKNTSADHSLEKEMEDIQKLKKVTEIMIINCGKLFPADRDLEDENELDLSTIDTEELKNMYQIKAIKLQVQSRELQAKEKELEELRDQVTQLTATVTEQDTVIKLSRNKIDSLEGYIERLEHNSSPQNDRPVPPPRSINTVLRGSPDSIRRRSQPIKMRPATYCEMSTPDSTDEEEDVI